MNMAYEFFFSYTRANNDTYLKKFFDDLSQAIRDIRGEAQNAEVGFFDQRELELGEEWDAAIVSALQTSKVFVAVTSPAGTSRANTAARSGASFTIGLPSGEATCRRC